MTSDVRKRQQRAIPLVLDWLMIVMSLGTIAWISFRPFGG